LIPFVGCNVEQLAPAAHHALYVPATAQASGREEERPNIFQKCYIFECSMREATYTSLSENLSMNSSVMTTKGWVGPWGALARWMMNDVCCAYVANIGSTDAVHYVGVIDTCGVGGGSGGGRGGDGICWNRKVPLNEQVSATVKPVDFLEKRLGRGKRSTHFIH
jgi:hypothetical protein